MGPRFLAGVTALAMAGSAFGQTSLVALTGTTVDPATGQPLNIAWSPTLGLNGQVIFSSQSGGGGGVPLLGFVGWDGSGLRTVVNDTTVVSGGYYILNVAPSWSRPLPVSAAGRTAFFLASNNASFTQFGTGIYSETTGPLQTVAQTNPATADPGTGIPFTTFFRPPAVSPDGSVGFTAQYSMPSPPASGNGVYRVVNGQLQTVAAGDVPVGGGAVVRPEIGSVRMNAGGTTTFTGSRVLPSLAGDGQSLLTATPAGGVTELGRAATGTPASAVPGRPDLWFRTFYSNSVSINNAGTVAYWAETHAAAQPAAPGSGIFLNNGGTTHVLALADHVENTTVVISGTQVPRTPTGTRFTSFFSASVAVGGDGTAAFFGDYPLPNTTTARGLFAAAPNGTLRSVALPGDTLPGGGTLRLFGGGDVNFDSAPSLAVNALSQIAFVADTVETTATGVYLADPDGTLRAVAVPGQSWDLDGLPGGSSGVISYATASGVSGGQDGRGTFLNDAGQIAIEIQFTNGQLGIYVVTMAPVPEPVGVVAAGVLGLTLLRRRRRAAQY